MLTGNGGESHGKVSPRLIFGNAAAFPLPLPRRPVKRGRAAMPLPDFLPGLELMLRATGRRLRPPRPAPFTPILRRRQDTVLAGAAAGPHQRGAWWQEARPGPLPTIVLGGFVPDATEAVWLLRDSLLRHGSLYCCNYPRRGFSTDLLLAELSDLVEELQLVHRRPPVILAISFGAGLLLEWLRRERAAAVSSAVRGLVLVSPVTCVEDLLPADEPRPGSLLGRALKPYVDAGFAIDAGLIERSRAIFHKMFEAGAQNRAALRGLLGPGELAVLRAAVLQSIREIDFRGACERIRALRALAPPAAGPGGAPLAAAPTLILYAEKESAVLAARAPSRAVLERAPRAWFPRAESRLVTHAGPGGPVQHASLIFHCADYRAPIADFYARLKSSKVKQAA